MHHLLCYETSLIDLVGIAPTASAPRSAALCLLSYEIEMWQEELHHHRGAYRLRYYTCHARLGLRPLTGCAFSHRFTR